jgi:Predicted phosphoesterases, related to the Icc protein
MERRIRKLRSQLRRTKGVDLVVTHSPVRGIGDMDTFSHKGFEAFLPFASQYKPKIWAFGHVHKSYSHEEKRIFRTEETTFVNACERLVIDYDEKTGTVSFPFQKENRSCIEIRLPEKTISY